MWITIASMNNPITSLLPCTLDLFFAVEDWTHLQNALVRHEIFSFSKLSPGNQASRASGLGWVRDAFSQTRKRSVA